MMGFDVGGITLTSPAGQPAATLSLDSGATNWMKVNANGIVSRTQAVYMRGALDNTVNGIPNPYNGNPVLVSAYDNASGCWNNATGRFTCPVAGYYLVQGAGIAGNQYGYFRLYKNGVQQCFTHWNIASTWHYTSLSAIVQAAVGDYFNWSIEPGSPSTAGFYYNGHGMYSIALLA